MRCLLPILLLASVFVCSRTEVIITPEPVSVAPAEVNPDVTIPSISHLLSNLGVSDPNGQIKKYLKFFTDPNMRNESAAAYNGIRQAAMDAYSCFKQKMQIELPKHQPEILSKLVSAMHQVQVPSEDSATQKNATFGDILSLLSPEMNIFTQLWSNPDFQDAYGQMRENLIMSFNEGMRCLRGKLSTIRKDVEWIVGNALHTFGNSTTPAPQPPTPAPQA